MESDDDGVERWMPTTWRIDRTMPLKMEIDIAVFTRITPSTPSEGAGRLERPISIKILDTKNSLKDGRTGIGPNESNISQM